MNQQQKQIISLMKKSRERKKTGEFVIEGIKLYEEAPKDRIRQTIVSETFAAGKNVNRLLKNVSYSVVSDAVFESLSDTKTPQGILAVVRQFTYTLEDLFPKEGNALILVLDTLQDPGNLGTILRAGEAAGVTGILMNSNTVDIYNPKVVRSTMGTIFRMPFVITEDLAGDCKKLQEKGLVCYAAHLEGKESYETFDYHGPSAFFIGNEANGLSDEIAALTDHKIRIPMAGKVESLNAAMAAAVLIFEAARQRRL